ncbi:MAG: hypothetical protein HQ503_01325 [Rhodospirillales bacterium]|nr:hypothetical protein [Rhodospirillales bacterium]
MAVFTSKDFDQQESVAFEHDEKSGLKATIADIDSDKSKRVAEEFCATIVPPEEIHRGRADVFLPCALGSAIDDQSVQEIQAPIIAGSANNQLAEPHHGDVLITRGGRYAPDYVINAGGLIDVTNGLKEYVVKESFGQIAHIYDRLLEIFERAVDEGRSTAIIAHRMAEEGFRRPPPVRLQAA